MRYETPNIKTVRMRELLTALGPARAWGYGDFGGPSGKGHGGHGDGHSD